MLLRNQQLIVLLQVFVTLHFMITAERDPQPIWGTVRWGVPSVGSWKALLGSACVWEQWDAIATPSSTCCSLHLALAPCSGGAKIEQRAAFDSTKKLNKNAGFCFN